MQPDASENEHAKQVYACYGLAMINAQHLEVVLAGLLKIFDLAPQLAASPPDERDELWASFVTRLDKQTMGQLTKRLITDETPAFFAERLETSTKKRNFLAHHFFRERTDQFMTAEGRAQLIDELWEIRNYLNGTVELLERLAKPAYEKMGITNEQVRKIGDEFVRKAREGTN